MLDFILQNLTLAWVLFGIDISVAVISLILIEFTFENHQTFKSDMYFFYSKKDEILKEKQDDNFQYWNKKHYLEDVSTLKEKMNLSYLYEVFSALTGLISAIAVILWILNILDPSFNPEIYDTYFKLMAIVFSLLSIPCLIFAIFIYRRYRNRYIYVIKKLQEELIRLKDGLNHKQ